MSWSRISRIFDKKIMDEVQRQLNIEVSKGGGLNVRNVKRCRFKPPYL
ncbi:MAG: hypothetical protein ACUVTM_07650 [Candidatus Bathyarchaeia archaeon]